MTAVDNGAVTSRPPSAVFPCSEGTTGHSRAFPRGAGSIFGMRGLMGGRPLGKAPREGTVFTPLFSTQSVRRGSSGRAAGGPAPAADRPATGARGSASACQAGRDTTAAKVRRQERRMR